MINYRTALAALLVGALPLPGSSAAHAQAPVPPADQPVPAPFKPSFGDYMNTLVQPRHAKLGLIGRERNWTLAAYEIHQLKAALANIAKWQPLFGKIPVADMMASTVDPPVSDMEKAVQARDPHQFDDAYVRLTAGCNACHTALHHGEVVIQEPDESTFRNQNFKPKN
jgi:hypothetical protein